MFVSILGLWVIQHSRQCQEWAYSWDTQFRLGQSLVGHSYNPVSYCNNCIAIIIVLVVIFHSSQDVCRSYWLPAGNPTRNCDLASQIAFDTQQVDTVVVESSQKATLQPRGRLPYLQLGYASGWGRTKMCGWTSPVGEHRAGSCRRVPVSLFQMTEAGDLCLNKERKRGQWHTLLLADPHYRKLLLLLSSELCCISKARCFSSY